MQEEFDMTSIRFDAPQHINPTEVETWAPGTLFVIGEPQRIRSGDYVYVCHRGVCLFRAPWQKNEPRDSRVNTEGDDQGPGWVMIVGDREPPQTDQQRLPPPRSPGPGFRYIGDWEHG